MVDQSRATTESKYYKQYFFLITRNQLCILYTRYIIIDKGSIAGVQVTLEGKEAATRTEERVWYGSKANSLIKATKNKKIHNFTQHA